MSSTQKGYPLIHMKQPANVSELQRFLDMVNQLDKFSPNIAELSENYLVPKLFGLGVLVKQKPLTS